MVFKTVSISSDSSQLRVAARVENALRSRVKSAGSPVWLGAVALEVLYKLWNQPGLSWEERKLLIPSQDLTLDIRLQPLAGSDTRRNLVQVVNAQAYDSSSRERLHLSRGPDLVYCPRINSQPGEPLVEHHLYVDSIPSQGILLNVVERINSEGDPPQDILSAHPSLLFIRTLHRIGVETVSMSRQQSLLSGTERYSQAEPAIRSRIENHKNRRSAQVFILRLLVELLVETGHDVITASDAVWFPRLGAALPIMYDSLEVFRQMVALFDCREFAEEQALWQTRIIGHRGSFESLLRRNEQAFSHAQTWVNPQIPFAFVAKQLLTRFRFFPLQLARGRTLAAGIEPPSYDPRHHRSRAGHTLIPPPPQARTAFRVGRRGNRSRPKVVANRF